MHRRRSTATAAAAASALLALVLTACGGPTGTVAVAPVAAPQTGAGDPSAAPGPSGAEAPGGGGAADPTAAPTPTTAVPDGGPAAPAAGSHDVAATQRTLTRLGYYLGAADGKAGPAMHSAVMAFQKVHGLGADGVVGPATLAALAAPVTPVLRASSPADRVEVDLTKQVLYVVEGGAVQRILPISSGNGATYRQKDGSTARALTPTGWFTIERRIVGERRADLGILYDPQYFYRGWAIHGSNSVPAVPASHGCVRVTRADAKWLLGAIGNGTKVFLYGGTHVFGSGSAAAGTDAPSGDAGKAPAAAAPAAAAPAADAAPAPAAAPAAPAARPTPAAVPAPAAAPAPRQSPAPAAPVVPVPTASASSSPASVTTVPLPPTQGGASSTPGAAAAGPTALTAPKIPSASAVPPAVGTAR